MGKNGIDDVLMTSFWADVVYV